MNVNLTILIADDDADDRFMLKEAFEENGIANKLVFAEDGDALIKMLESQKGSHPEFPGLILLDLNSSRS